MRSFVLALVLVLCTVALAEPKPGPLVAQLPPTAVGAVIIEREMTELLRKLVEGRPALRAELSEYLQRKLGFDLFAITGVAAWVEGFAPPRVSIYLRGPRLLGKSDLAPVQLSTAQGGILMTGPHSGPAAPNAPASTLGKLLADTANAELVVALVDFSFDPSLAAMAKQFGVETARVVMTKTTVRAEASGNPQQLELIGKMVVSGLAIAMDKVSKEREAALAKPEVTADGAAAIWGYHQLLAAQQELAPRIVGGNKLVFEYKLPDLTAMSASMPVAIVGVLAAVAIPSFTKYTKRSKSVEARTQLARAATGLATLVESNQASIGKFRFPPSTGWTPPAPCAQQPGGKCRGFQGKSWEQLGFALADDHYFQYKLTTSGVGKKATWKLEAQGDLDGNGVFSRYTLEGGIGPDGTLQQQPISVENDGE